MKITFGLKLNLKSGSIYTILYYLFFLLFLFTGLNINREFGSPLYALNVVGVWTGIFFCFLSLLLIFIHLLHFMAGHLSSEAPVPPLSSPLNIFERTFNVTGWIFLLFSFMIFLNASLNASMEFHASTALPVKIIKVNEVDAPLIPTFPLISVKVGMNDEPQKQFSIFLANRNFNHIWEGEFVQVKMGSGAFGLPWVDGLEEDREKMTQLVLKVFPKAVIAWKDLINFYMEHKEWENLSAAAKEYLNLNPTDFNLLENIGTTLINSFHDKEALPIYEYVFSHQPTSQNLLSFGICLHNTGNNLRSASILDQAKSLDPNNWEIYFHLGVAYYDLHDWKNSLTNFQKVLEFRPTFPQVEGLVADIKGKIIAFNH